MKILLNIARSYYLGQMDADLFKRNLIQHIKEMSNDDCLTLAVILERGRMAGVPKLSPQRRVRAK